MGGFLLLTAGSAGEHTGQEGMKFPGIPETVSGHKVAEKQARVGVAVEKRRVPVIKVQLIPVSTEFVEGIQAVPPEAGGPQTPGPAKHLRVPSPGKRQYGPFFASQGDLAGDDPGEWMTGLVQEQFSPDLISVA
jgi:hypothetical protein